MEKEKKLKVYPLSELEDEFIGNVGSPERDLYEYDLKMEILGELIRETRKKRNLTQSELGELIGVKKSTISKLERQAKNVTIDTLIRVFNALKTTIKFRIEIDHGTKIEIAQA